MLIGGCRLVLADEMVWPGWLEVRGDRITGLGAGPTRPADIDLDGSWVLPGFVDIHNHGGGGASFSTGEQRAVEIAAGFHRRHGTTTVLASLVSGPIDDLADSIVAIRRSLARGMVAGVHLEGPFLNRVRCGAHDPAHLRDPTLPDVERLLAAAEGAVRMITLAPELDGAIDAVRLVAAAGVTAAIGHTDCTYEVARAAIDAGATVATHLYNAMPPTKARHPGPVLACLEDDRVCVELIADGVHLHSATLAHAAAVAGAGRTALVSDCTPLAGACGQASRLGTVAVEVRGVSAFVAGSQTLAGSLLTLDVALRKAVDAGVPFFEAVRAVTSAPAAAVGLAGRAGVIEVGRTADLVVLTPDLELQAVLAGGSWVDGVAGR